MKKHLPLGTAVLLFIALVCFSARAAEGARQGLSLCANTLAPSLFPFFVLSNLLTSLGLPDLLGQRLEPLARRLFRVSGCGTQAFFLGISGGYPLGASVTAELRRNRQISQGEAQQLLAFCNNSGPAFILGAVGGVFDSPRAGILLYATHVLAALCVGLVFRRESDNAPGKPPPPPPVPVPVSFGQAFPVAVSRALNTTVTVCGYVVLFSALLNLFELPAGFSPLTKAMLAGFLELGSGIAALRGLSLTPLHLAAAAFLLGWGGVSVHLQTLGITADTDIKCARHLLGRALCGVFAGIFTYVGALLLF